MAVGDREFRIKKVVLETDIRVVIECEYQVVAKVVDESDKRAMAIEVSWDEFTASLAKSETDAIAVMQSKAADFIKERISILTSAEDKT